MSYAPEVQTDNTGKWYGNALRFATKEEAQKNVDDLALRWYSVRQTRVFESPDPVNCTFKNGKTVPIKGTESTPAGAKVILALAVISFITTATAAQACPAPLYWACSVYGSKTICQCK